MTFTLATLAEQLRGRLTGDGSLIVTGVVSPAQAAGPTELALAMEPAELGRLAGSRTRIAVTTENAVVPEGLLDGCITVRRPRHALRILSTLFERPYHFERGVHPLASVDPAAVIGGNVAIAPFVSIGPRARIGDNTILMPHATIGADAILGRDCLIHAGAAIGERVRIGDRVIVHMNAAIGADGFSFVTLDRSSAETARSLGDAVASAGLPLRVNSLGTVIVHDDVEIGACATIDRATIAATVIGRGTKIDNLVTIAHNNVLGENCMMSGQTGIAGSCTIGNRIVFGGQVGVADHITVGDDVVTAGRSKLIRNVPAKTVMMGVPAVPLADYVAQQLNETRMGRYFRKIDALAARIKAAEAKAQDSTGAAG